MQPPDRVRTERLLLRRWQPADATLLHEVLDVSVEHLRPWIPWSVAEPAPVSVLEERLARYVEDFDADRWWLYGLFSHDETVLYGGVGLYPRDNAGRAPSSDATHVEIGYWLRESATGLGYATEAAQATMALAWRFSHFSRIEIRCDPNNLASIAVPARLGFRYCDPRTASAPGTLDFDSVWEYPLARMTPITGTLVITDDLI